MTRKFICSLKHAPDGILDLNNAAETLEVGMSSLNLLVLSQFMEMVTDFSIEKDPAQI